MDKTVDSHIPINLRRWLDEQIEREMTDCGPLGFHGLMTALTEATPEDTILSLNIAAADRN